MVPRVSELADWLGRGYRAMSLGQWVASTVFGGAVVIALLHDAEHWFGIGWFVVFCIGVLGLLSMLIAAVLGYRDPLSPWQLAMRMQRLAARMARFGEEMHGDYWLTTGFRSGPTAPVRSEEWLVQQAEAGRKVLGHEARVAALYNMRIAPVFGGIIEDMKDAGYEIPDKLQAYFTSESVSYPRLREVSKELAVVAEQLRRRRIRPRSEPNG